jgi:glucose 1-dehydrogenase
MNTHPIYPEFKGKRALITGGTKGIGKAIGRRLARNGATVYLNYSGDEKAAAETLTEFRSEGWNIEIIKTDMSDAKAIEVMLEKLHATGPLDLYVGNAAYQEKKGLLDTNVELLQRTLAVNLIANFQIVRSVSQAMIAAKRPGRIVLSSSGHGTLVTTDATAYAASKAALNHFMRCAALELIGNDIRVNAVEIGWTHTPGERRWFSEDEQTKQARAIPIGRAADADEIAAVTEFLLSEQASYVVGSLYSVAGGVTLRQHSETANS